MEICGYCHNERIPATSETTGCCDGERQESGYGLKSEFYANMVLACNRLRFITIRLDRSLKESPMPPQFLKNLQEDAFQDVVRAMLRCQ